MKRRKLITLLGSAIAWPLAVRAQPSQGVKRIAALMGGASDDPNQVARLAAFTQGLEQYGWTVGRNLQIDVRWSAGDAEHTPRNWPRSPLMW
jgi:putative ABC transport system substrate-binding protein